MQIDRLFHAALPLLAAALPLTAGAAAQSMTDKAVEAEIEFARGLSRDWAFVDMAQTVLDNVANADVSERMNEELSLVRCEVFTNAAKATRDAGKRGELLEQAIKAYEDYLSDNAYAANRTQAERSLVDLAVTYARNVDIALEDAVGEEAAAMRASKVDILQTAIARTEMLIDGINEIPDEDRTQPQKMERLGLILQKADMYARVAENDPNDTFFGEQAIETYSEILFDSDGGEDTELGLRANAGIGQVFENQGDDETAREFYGGVVLKVIPKDPDEREELLGWKDLEMGIKQKRFLYVELGIPGTQRTSRALGDLEFGIDLALYFYNLYRQEGFQLSSLGHAAMLEVAETFLDAGGFIGGDAGAGEAKWYATEEDLTAAKVNRRQRQTAVDFALDLARQVASDASGSREGVLAGLLLDRINERPGIELPPEQLYQAAIAKYRAGEDNQGALLAFYDLLDRLDTLEPADRVEFGAKTYNGIGNTLQRQERLLESAMAFREALVNWRDPEWNSSNAKRYASVMRQFARAANSAKDPKVEAMVTEAEGFVIQFGEDATVDMILFNQAEKELQRKNFEDAIAKYEEITDAMSMYEPAQIRIGQCMMQLRQFAKARDKFDAFIDVRVKDPRFAPNTPVAEDRRHQALGRAIFNGAYIDNLSANNKYKKSEGKDASGYAKVIERLTGYAGEYRDVGNTSVVAQAMLASAFARSGDSVKAAGVLEEMIADFPDASETADAAIDLYKAYGANRDRLEAVTGEGRDGAAITKSTQDMVNALRVANDITPAASYTNLRIESRLWQELSDWKEALVPLTNIVQRFKDDEEKGDTVLKQVIPDLAEALIETGDVLGAKELLSPYVIGEGAPLRTRTPTILMARAMIGSLVNNGTRVQANPGAGGTDEEFAFIADRLDSIENSIDKWTCEWYEAKFTAIYAYYVWGQQDDRKLASAKRIINSLVTDMGGDTQFALVDEGCDQPDTDPMIKRRLGGDILAARYRWLYSATR